MRSWQIVALSALAATIVAVALFFRDMTLTSAALMPLILARWWPVSVVWLGSYGIAAGVLATIAALVKSQRWRTSHMAISANSVRLGSAFQTGFAPVRTYLVELAVVQFGTCVVVLVGLGVWQLRENGAFWPPTTAALIDSPALIAMEAVAATGLLGLFVIAATQQWSRTWKNRRPAAESPELQLLRHILELLKKERSTDEENIVKALEQRQRSVLEAIRDVASAVDRLSRGLDKLGKDIKESLPSRDEALMHNMEVNQVSPEHTVELQRTLAALNAVATTLRELASSAGDSKGLVSTGARRQVSTELDELLRDMTGDRDRQPVVDDAGEPAAERP